MKTTAAETLTSAKWVLDTSHSELAFRVKHLMISNIKGEFRNFTVEINGEDFTRSPIDVEIDATSIYTNEPQRDAHLKSSDFFDVETFPTLSFRSSGLRLDYDNKYLMKGLLTIKDLSREVTLHVEFNGVNRDPDGNEKAGFSIEGKINRKDFGLHWNAALETGGVLVGEEVRIYAEVQFLKQV